MTKYILDTNIVSYLERASSIYHKPVICNLSKLSDADQVCVSILTIYEFQYSVSLAPSVDRERIRSFNEYLYCLFQLLPLTKQGAVYFSEIKAAYQNQTGISKKAVDRHNINFMLACTAIDADAVLVSNDKIFSDVQKSYQNLKLADWTLS